MRAVLLPVNLAQAAKVKWGRGQSHNFIEEERVDLLPAPFQSFLNIPCGENLFKQKKLTIAEYIFFFLHILKCVGRGGLQQNPAVLNDSDI